MNTPAQAYTAPPNDVYEPFEPYVFDHRPVPVTPFEYRLRDFFDEYFLAHPVQASEVGDHRFDNRWPDLSGTGRLARIAMLRRWRASFERLDDLGLTLDERVDRRILLEVLDARLFEEEALREETWNPLFYVELIGNGLFGLLAREYAPWHHRGEAFVRRLRHLPGVVAAARENLLGMPDRPVSRLHTETAIEELAGIPELIDSAVGLAEANRYDEDAFRLPPRFADVVPSARDALEELRAFLERDVLPRSRGDGRLGRALYETRLPHILGSDLGPDELLARAQRDADAVRTEMVRLARELWPRWIGEEPLPGQARPSPAADALVVRRVLDAIAAEHRRPEELLATCTDEVARIERFVRRNRMIGLPHEPLEITWTPAFMRALGGAFLSPPGPLEKGQKSLFWITPPGEDWPPERTESYLREDNDRALRLLCLHEAVPGHYLQGWWSNRCPSLVRSIFASATFAEGWAVYVTQAMMDVGYGRRDPALMLSHWKYYLRAVINAILDVRIHAGDMDEDEAMRLMVEEGFQEEQEARAKWLRARLTSTQLSTYFVGSLELGDLEIEARRRWAEAHGGRRGDVPDPRVVGGYGDVGDFDFRGHLQAVISHGSPPVRWVRRIVLGEVTVRATA